MPKDNIPEYRFYQVLLKLARFRAIDDGELDICFKEINEAISQALEVDRSSIWLYNTNMTEINCADLYVRSEKKHSSGSVLKQKDFPNYFSYLLEKRTLTVGDVLKDAATLEFTENYSIPLNIKSLLDAPIIVGEKMLGVICCEDIDQHRAWSISEQIFIGNISDILARAIQAKERVEATRKLESMNKNLERLIRDRTEELEEQKSRTENSSKMAILGEMAGSIAHEINNPLAIILSSISMLRSMIISEEYTKDEKEAVISSIKETTLRIDKIVRGLRFFARDASHDQFNLSSVKQILEDTLILCRQKFHLKGCNIITNIPREDIQLLCQPVSISQALLNLLGNALDAIEEDTTKWIRIDCSETINCIELRITDSGDGIKKNLKDKIMVPFFTTKSVGKGTGLGLSIVKGIIEQHNGIFRLDDLLPNTSFVMTFPKSEVSE